MSISFPAVVETLVRLNGYQGSGTYHLVPSGAVGAVHWEHTTVSEYHNDVR